MEEWLTSLSFYFFLLNMVLYMLFFLLLSQFDPELVIVSAGYDSAIGDCKASNSYNSTLFLVVIHSSFFICCVFLSFLSIFFIETALVSRLNFLFHHACEKIGEQISTCRNMQKVAVESKMLGDHVCPRMRYHTPPTETPVTQK